MKTEQKRYTVLLSASEWDLKQEGFGRWFKKNIKKAIVAAGILLCLVWAWMMWKTIFTAILVVVGINSFFALYFFISNKTGKEFFNKVKDLPEPIDLREK